MSFCDGFSFKLGSMWAEFLIAIGIVGGIFLVFFLLYLVAYVLSGKEARDAEIKRLSGK